MSALGELFDRAQREVDERLPACQLAVARDGELIGYETFGNASNDTRFLMWSCTKTVVAGVVWQLVGEGLLDYERTVASNLPVFGTNGKDVVTVEQLLLHTAGFPLAPLGPTRWFESETRREAFARWRLNWEPGTQYQYHPVSAHWVLAELIVEVTGNDYRTEVAKRIAEPLGLEKLKLGVPDDEQGDIAEVVAVGGAGEPALLAMNAPAARSVGIPGGGGITTAADLALYYQALVRNPAGLWDAGVLADATSVVRNTFADVPKWSMPANRSRGVVIRGDHPGAERMHHFGPGTSPRSFGHDGAGGQIAWADPDSGLSFAFLTNGMEVDGDRERSRCQDFARLAAQLAE
jgi:CubicO group peptidase (beta-lactamase class C family)